MNYLILYPPKYHFIPEWIYEKFNIRPRAGMRSLRHLKNNGDSYIITPTINARGYRGDIVIQAFYTKEFESPEEQNIVNIARHCAKRFKIWEPPNTVESFKYKVGDVVLAKTTKGLPFVAEVKGRDATRFGYKYELNVVSDYWWNENDIEPYDCPTQKSEAAVKLNDILL